MKIAVFVLLIAFNGFASYAFSAETKNKIEQATEKLKSLNSLRETLAASIDPSKKIDHNTFKTTCMPVGKELKSWGHKQGYTVRQVSNKYRNPKHKPTSQEMKVLEQFAQDQAKTSIFETSASKGQKGSHLYVRIPTVKACLNCHGPKDSRPSFIQNKYPNDRAYDFKPGELRGMYSVFLPE